MSEKWIVGTCWGCGSEKISQAPDYRPVDEPKYFCRNCRTYSDSVRPFARAQGSAKEIEKEMRDAYWGAKDEFEHDIKELFGHFISPEEFEKKWRPKLKETHEKGSLILNRPP